MLCGFLGLRRASKFPPMCYEPLSFIQLMSPHDHILHCFICVRLVVNINGCDPHHTKMCRKNKPAIAT